MHRIFVLYGTHDLRVLKSFLHANAMQMADAGKTLAVEITEHKAKRTIEQNRRYFGVLLKQIAENAWVVGKQFSEDAWHEYFKRKFIGIEETPDGGTVGISSTSLSVSVFGDFMTQVEMFADTELGIEIA